MISNSRPNLLSRRMTLLLEKTLRSPRNKIWFPSSNTSRTLMNLKSPSTFKSVKSTSFSETPP